MNTADMMGALASGLDEALNGDAKGADRKTGFVLLVFPMGEIGPNTVNYVSSGERKDVRAAMKELLARWDGALQEPQAIQ